MVEQLTVFKLVFLTDDSAPRCLWTLCCIVECVGQLQVTQITVTTQTPNRERNVKRSNQLRLLLIGVKISL